MPTEVALMARIGHASAAAALEYQHVIDGFGEEPPMSPVPNTVP